MKQTKSSRTITDYLSAIRQFPPDREAVVTRKRTVTFGTLAEMAQQIRKTEGLAEDGAEGCGTSGETAPRVLTPLPAGDSLSEIAFFFAYSGTRKIPLFLPRDTVLSEELTGAAIPERTAMAVMTSGSYGKQKLFFRTFESWYDFFPVQNEIFSMGAGTRCFFEGSLAFTGNLNLVIAQIASGGTVISEEIFDPRLWRRRITDDRADVVYLIPSKLRALLDTCEHREETAPEKKPGASSASAAPSVFPGVRSIVSGSQSLGGNDASALRRIFPNAVLTLYYGASELSYVTYLRGDEMGADPSVIGRPFPGISVRSEASGLLHVTTPYGVIGLPADASIGDCGHRNRDGLWCFDGRADDLLNLRGRKISAQKVQNALLSLPGIRDAAVLLLPAAQAGAADPVLTAFLVKSRDESSASERDSSESAGDAGAAVRDSSESAAGSGAAARSRSASVRNLDASADPQEFRHLLSDSLFSWEIPKRFVFLPEIPKNESGKTDLRALKKLPQIR